MSKEGNTVDMVYIPENNRPTVAKKNHIKDQKPDLSIIPEGLMDQLSYCMMAGAEKYGRNNYKLGHTSNDLSSAVQRHAKKIDSGENVDADCTKYLKDNLGIEQEVFHWACIAANAAMALEQIRLNTHVFNNKDGIL